MRNLILFRLVKSVLALAVLLTSYPGAVQAQWNANAQLCAPKATGLPHDPSPSKIPTIDGVVSGDHGWTGAWRYEFDNGTFVPNAVAQVITDPDPSQTNLYLSFEVNNDPDFDPGDAVVIGFDPTGNDADREWLVVYPFAGGPGGPGGAAATVNYYKGWVSTPTGHWLSTAVPAGVVAYAKHVGAGATASWNLELKLPRAAFGLATSNKFGMYFYINKTVASSVVPYQWPSNAPTLDFTLLNSPDPSTWGEAHLATGKSNNAACKGISISPSDIYTDNSPPNKINLTGQNTFHAIVHNDMITPYDNPSTHQPDPVTAHGIRATFKIADFGVSGYTQTAGQWNAIVPTPPATNPTAPADIPGNGGTADLTTSWTLNATQSAHYSQPMHTHQCILVELSTTASTPPGSVVFTHKSAWQNMNFGTASKFNFHPVIDPRGWKPPVHGNQQRLVLTVTHRIDQLQRDKVLKQLNVARLAPRPLFAADMPLAEPTNTATVSTAPRPGTGVVPIGSSPGWARLKDITHFPAEHNADFKAYVAKLKNPKAQVTQLTYIVNACRPSGRFVTVHSKKYEICEPVGAFGYVLRHAALGGVKWEASLAGPGVKRIGNTNRYEMKLAAGKPVQISNSMDATDASTPVCSALSNPLVKHN